MNAKPLTESVIKKIQMAKLLYDLGADCFRVSENPEKIGAGIVLLQDSVEIFLIAVCEHLEVPLDDYVPFDKYFVKLKEKTEKEVALKKQMLLLNRQRVGIKHHGVLPHIDHCKDFPATVRTFFQESATHYLNTDFESITLVDLLNDGKPKELLKEAESYLKSGDYQNCQINCRKALYLTFEKRSDIRPFEKEENGKGLLSALFCDAPYYAHNKKYIEQNVKDPIDYILIDHDKLNKYLLLNGILPTDFWNIWRLTPPMYYYEDEDDWVIEDEFKKDVYNEENAEYCFRKIVEILLLKQSCSEKTKYIGERGTLIKIKNKKIKVFEKASLKSKVVFEMEDAPAKIYSFRKVRGLDDKKNYYYITHEFEKDGKNFCIFGYICEDDVENL